MRARSGIILASAFTLSFLAVGVPYWSVPYADVALPNTICGAGLIVVAGLAGLCRFLCTTGPWSTTTIIGASVPSAVMARVLYDTWADPTSHNLWPFEISLAAGPGFVAAFVGAIAGGLATRRGEVRPPPTPRTTPTGSASRRPPLASDTCDGLAGVGEAPAASVARRARP